MGVDVFRWVRPCRPDLQASGMVLPLRERTVAVPQMCWAWGEGDALGPPAAGSGLREIPQGNRVEGEA